MTKTAKPTATPMALVDDMTARNPQSVAVSWSGGQLTYAELQTAVRRAARAIERTAGGRGRVGLHGRPSPAWIVAMLGCATAGIAYVPIDPGWPDTRKQFVASDAQLAAVLCGSDDGPMPWSGAIRTAHLPGITDEEPDRPHTEVAARLAADRPLYVIYTSGTTGRPKGVEISHSNLGSLLAAAIPLTNPRSDDVWLLFHSTAFDFSVWEIWGALASGARLHIPDPFVTRDPARCAALIRDEGVTVLNQTPAAFHTLQPFLLAAFQKDPRKPPRTIIFGGERLTPRLLRPTLEAWPSTELINMYGITEITVHATYRTINEADTSSDESPIGRPLAGFDVLLVDDELTPVPDGVIGELLLAGPQVSAGYIGQPDLTAARFVTLVDGSTGTPRRYYRSGDNAYRRADGLYYVGRADGQVKVRGFRIELGEVEAAAKAHRGLLDAVALVVEFEPHDDRLIALCVREDETVDARSVRSHLRARLPDYMVPSHVVWTDQLPRTVNDKVDRVAAALIVKEFFDEQDSRLASV